MRTEPTATAEDIFSMTGRTVLITGASDGIGRHAALLFAARGARVALAARRLDRTRAIADELRAKGMQAAAVYIDVVEPASIARAFDEAQVQLGAPVDVLLNNAGVLVAEKFLDQTFDTMSKVIDTNFKGAFAVAQEAASRMVKHGGGTIVNVGSTAGMRSGSFMASYGASKAALAQLTQVMALELAGKGVRVNQLNPGNIATCMQAQLDGKGFTDAMVMRTPLRRIGSVSDLDGALLLLASDAGRYMTGSTIVVDGGQTLSWM